MFWLFGYCWLELLYFCCQTAAGLLYLILCWVNLSTRAWHLHGSRGLDQMELCAAEQVRWAPPGRHLHTHTHTRHIKWASGFSGKLWVVVYELRRCTSVPWGRVFFSPLKIWKSDTSAQADLLYSESLYVQLREEKSIWMRTSHIHNHHHLWHKC